MTMDKTLLNPSSPQFSRLEYLLQISLHACTARITEAYQYSAPHQLMNFEKKAQNRLVLTSWVDTVPLTGGHPEEELIKRCSNSGMIFPVGRIQMNQNSKKEAGAKIVKKMMLCEIVVGRSFAVSDISSVGKEPLPNGFDSLYIFEGEKQNESPQTHKYFLKDSTQVLPTFLVTFEYDPIEEKRSREKPMCDSCEQAFATVYCHADQAHFCADCDTRLHMANKVLQKHHRTPVGKGSDVLGQCRIHPGQMIEFFCTQCQQPVCVHCKMVGNHSSGEASRHKLVTVAEAFDSVLKESSKKEAGLQAKCSAVNNHLKLLRNRTKQVEDHHALLEAELQKMFENLMNSLRQKTSMKLNTLLSDELECRRLISEMQEMESFLEYQQTGRDVYPLLCSWGRHVQLRQDWMETRQVREDIDVFPDLKIAGSINVSVDELAQRPPKSPRKSVSNQPPTSQRAPSQAQNKRAIRRTSDFFAEALGSLSLDQSAYTVNAMMDDEKSFTTAGYEDMKY